MQGFKFWILLAALLLAPGVTQAAVDEETSHALEGNWLIGEKPADGPCTAHWYKSTELEFEFRKTGGRLMEYQHYDLFTPIWLSGIEKKDGVLHLQAEANDGSGPVTFMQLRIIDRDRLEILARDGSWQTGYRCGSADNGAIDAVPLERLLKLTPRTSGGNAGFVEIPDGKSVIDFCSRQADPISTGWILLEVFGPSHRWILAMQHESRRLEFDYIRAIRVVDDHTLKLSMQAHIATGSEAGWDVPASRGERYELTVIDHGEYLEIPQIGRRLTDCGANKPGGVPDARP